MERCVFLFLLFLPTFVSAQGNGERLASLKKLNEKYNIQRLVSADAAIVEKNELYGLVSLDGKTLLPAEYNIISETDGSSLLMLWKNGNAGFADRKGKIVIPVKYELGNIIGNGPPIFSDGMTEVQLGEKYGVVDTTGRIVVPIKYDWFVYVDKNANVIITYDYIEENLCIIMSLDGDTLLVADEYLDAYGDGLLAFKKNGLWGLYDTKNRKVIQHNYEDIRSDNGGLFSVKEKGRWRIIDKNNKEKYSEAKRYIDDTSVFFPGKWNLIWGFKGSKFGAVDTKGNTIIPFRDHHIIDDNVRDRIVMMDDDNTTICVYDGKGNKIATYQSTYYDFEEDYGLERMPFEVDGSFSLLDIKENKILPFRYKEMNLVDGKHFAVKLDDGSKSLIDNEGNIIFKAPFEWIDYIGFGMYKFAVSTGPGHDDITVHFADEKGNSTY